MAKDKTVMYNEQYADLLYTEPVGTYTWPTELEWIVEDIAVLKATDYKDYLAKEKEERLEKPWREQLIKIVDKIVVNARYYDSTRNTNEAEWRVLDEDIFGRYKNIIVCVTCGDRLWRSELEVSVNEDHPFFTKIRHDRESRATCRCAIECPDKEWIGRLGINSELHSRLETFVRDEFGKRKKPDRVHGIRIPKDCNISIPEIYQINAHPFASTAKGPPLFPYLVHEAKSDMSSSTLSDLQHQMKLPIRALLRAQESLRAFNGPHSAQHGGPLVWVLSNWGFVWDISVAYIDETIEKDKKYVVNYLWSGNVRKEEDALQLLLILDYILDWAIDIYRPTVLNELRIFGEKRIHSGIEAQPQKQAAEPREKRARGRTPTNPRRRTVSEISAYRFKVTQEHLPELDLVTTNLSKDLIKRFNEISYAESKQGLEFVKLEIGEPLPQYDLLGLEKSMSSIFSNSSSETVTSDIVAPTNTDEKTYDLRSRPKQVPDMMASVSANVASQTSHTGIPIFSDTKDDITPYHSISSGESS